MMNQLTKQMIALAVLATAWNGISIVQAQTPDQPAAAAAVAQPEAQDVPVTAVQLFSSGVGYFEHAGQVVGDARTDLRFHAGQINDILKSLVLQDLDGGTVKAVRYASNDPLAKTLGSFQVNLAENPSMAELLNALRGEAIVVDFGGGEKITGTILGVEQREMPVGDKTVQKSFLNVLSGASIRSIDMSKVVNFEFQSARLQEDFVRALAAVAQSRDQDKKAVAIQFSGAGQRRVRIGYVVETPVWKTSYRLVLPSKDEKAKLQGWAIVENQTDADWNGVALSLVSGRPISFQMKLYEPLYVSRPYVEPQLFASLRPQLYAEAMAEMRDAATEAPQQKAAARSRRGDLQASFGGAAAAPAAAPVPMDATSSVQSIAAAAQLGELFSYTVNDVTLPRQSSAMLPIVTDDIDAKRVSIYNAAVLADHPLNGARLTNSTDKHLSAGPITVLDAGAYAGDAQIENLPPGQNRLLSYGIDLAMLIDSTKATNESAIVSAKINRGVLYLSRKQVATKTYTAANKSNASRTLLIEHPLRGGWSLVDSAKPEETTATLYRFSTEVPAEKSASLVVKEQIVVGESVGILPLEPAQLLAYARSGEIPQATRDALAKAAAMKQALADTQRNVAELSKQLDAVSNEQQRIRENMKTVDEKSEYYNRLLTKLNEQESRIEKMQTQRDEQQQHAEQQRAEFEKYISELNVD